MMSVTRRTKGQQVFTGIESDCLGNSVNKNVPVEPIDSRSTGGIEFRIFSANAFTHQLQDDDHRSLLAADKFRKLTYQHDSSLFLASKPIPLPRIHFSRTAF
ncbi:unnamed protein product [Protopolystoma xenopodis]|uniref:Uncharacterized protein n=1 Tax=Protopolystoma xenopodis TaxID=117903 RepID=A0A448WN65_9PLAT|nr:unnamed protein product [Protopolystoma xenopodis]